MQNIVAHGDMAIMCCGQEENVFIFVIMTQLYVVCLYKSFTFTDDLRREKLEESMFCEENANRQIVVEYTACIGVIKNGWIASRGETI